MRATTWVVYNGNDWVTTLHFNSPKTEEEARLHYASTYSYTKDLTFVPL